MRVEQAWVDLAAHHERTERFNMRERLSVQTVPGRAAGTPDRVDLSDGGRAAAAAEQIRKAGDEAARDPRVALLIALLERLTGRCVCRLRPVSQDTPPRSEATPAGAAAAGPSFSLRYELDAERQLREQVTFQARALVRTRDGREIAVQVAFSLAREEAERLSLRVGMGEEVAAKDPLVLNFAGTSAQLTEGRFAFDLDGDGQTEAMPFLTAGSAFLALDRNGDGRVTDGRELFGPTTGDGFAELAGFDADGNGFIDEADPVFHRLLLFNRTAQGDWVLPLAQAGVGAIHLGRVATPFETAAGWLRTSSFYLTEAGGAGTVQQVDIKI